MFHLTKKKIADKEPIAITNKKEYLYLSDVKYDMKNLNNKNLIKDLTQEQIKTLNECLKGEYEPDDQELTKKYYSIIEDIKKSNSKIVIKDSSKLSYIPSTEYIERVLVAGISGSGKSTWSSDYIEKYLKQHKKRKFYIISNVDEDEILDKLNPIRLDLETVAYDGIEIKDIEKSIMLLDDVDTIEDKAINKAIRGFTNNMLEVSRHYQTNLVITSHHLQNYRQTKTQLNEANIIVMFMKSNARAIKNYLKTYENFNDDLINRILNLNSRWAMLYKGFGHPQFILYEKGAFLV